MSQIIHLIRPKARDLGGGMTVRRILPAIEARSVGPFVFLDHIGPVTFAPGEGMDVRPHPHIGLATVTYLYAGEILHRDSLGYVQPIRPGDVNWMTAGRGIVHSERTAPELRAAGFTLHGAAPEWCVIRITKEFNTGVAVNVDDMGNIVSSGGTASTYGDIIKLGSNKTLVGIGSSAFSAS